MPGFSDYTAEAVINWETGAAPMPSTTAALSRYLALFVTAPTGDSGTGAVEVSGGGYARVQVAGQLQAAASGGSWTGTTLVLSGAAPAWLTALGTNGGNGVNVYDATGAANVGTVSTISGSTVILTGAVAHTVFNSDYLQFSAFPLASASSGTEPSVAPSNVTNGAQVNFAQATGTWGGGSMIPSWGVYDSSSSGDLICFDYMGNFKWIPFSCSSASPGVLTCDSAADAPANSSTVVVTQKYGGSLPATTGNWGGLLTTAGLSSNTFNVGVNTSSVGGGLFRQVTQFGPIGSGVTVSFNASNFTLTAA